MTTLADFHVKCKTGTLKIKGVSNAKLLKV